MSATAASSLTWGNRRHSRGMLLSGVAGFLVGLILHGAVLYRTSLEPPASVQIAPHFHLTVVRGEVAPVTFTAARSRECISEVTRWLWRDEPDGTRSVIQWSYAAMSFGGSDDNIPRQYQFGIPVPSSMPLGEWSVRTLHADYCSPWAYFLGPRLRASPPFGITIVDR